MSQNILNTGYVVNINNANVDIANLATVWAREGSDVNRQLISVGDGSYYFPTLNKGFNSTFNGQIVTIYNKIGSRLTINTGSGADVYFNGVYYSQKVNKTTFTMDDDKIAVFILTHQQYYVQVYFGST
jgi:hypothetical protein